MGWEEGHLATCWLMVKLQCSCTGLDHCWMTRGAERQPNGSMQQQGNLLRRWTQPRRHRRRRPVLCTHAEVRHDITVSVDSVSGGTKVWTVLARFASWATALFLCVEGKSSLQQRLLIKFRNRKSSTTLGCVTGIKIAHTFVFTFPYMAEFKRRKAFAAFFFVVQLWSNASQCGPTQASPKLNQVGVFPDGFAGLTDCILEKVTVHLSTWLDSK